MLQNYFKIAWRNLLKDRQFTLLNLVGLSTGLACALLIYLWTTDEMSVDKFNEKDSQLFQVMKNAPSADGIATVEYTQGLLASSLAKEMPEVQYAASVVPADWFSDKGIISSGTVQLREGAQFISKDYFNMFSYEFVDGNKDGIFNSKDAIIISDELAMKLFKTTQNLVGKTVDWNNSKFSGPFIISGVFKKPPANASSQFDLAFNYDLFLEKNPKAASWNNNDPSTYVLLKEGVNLERFNKKIAGFIKSKNAGSKETLFLQQYSKRYLYNHFENGVQSGGRISYVKLFTIIALFITIIACINFMNLSTAKASNRLKEIGIKKVIGASRRTLIVQYLTESMLMTICSVIVAIVIVAILLPGFNTITGKHLELAFDSNLILAICGITILTGVMAGSYPALYLSNFKPAIILKGAVSNAIGNSLARRALVVFQFTISVILIVSVLVVYKQIQFIQSKNLGYNRDHIIWFEKGSKATGDKEYYQPGGGYENDLAVFLQRLKNVPGVINASNFRHNITNRHGGTSAVTWQGKNPAQNIDFTDLAAGYDFIETLGIQMKEGRSFSRNYGSEKSKVVFNEAAIQSMGLKNPIGKIVNIWGEDKEIIGVAKNFHFESLYENLKPAFFDFSLNQRVSKIMVRIKAGTEKETIERIRGFYSDYNQGLGFEYTFLNDDYQALYASEQRVALLSRYFAGLAIIISCLGLFGLTAFSAQKRQKEIGIRKVVGASAGRIVAMLSKDFLQPVLIGFLIAFPLAWWACNQWLNDFAYRIHMGMDVFFITGISIILITLLTISFQSIKAALANPVKSLRSE